MSINQRKARAVGLAAVLVLSVIAGASFGVAGQAIDATPTESDDSIVAQDESDGQAQVVTIVEALRAAENETNGTAVGAQREGDFSIVEGVGEETPAGDEATPERTETATPGADALSDLAYNVDVLLDNGTHLEVSVNAANGTVVETSEAEQGFLASIFGEDDVPDRPLNLSAMRSAVDAVELAQNESDGDGTVTAVNLQERDDIGERDELLVYEVEMTSGEDEQRTVLIAAFPTEGDVVGTEGAEETTQTQTQTAET